MVDYQANMPSIATSAGLGRRWVPKLIVAAGLLAALIGGLLALAEPQHKAVWQGPLGLALAAPVFGSLGMALALRRERAAWVAVTVGFVVTFAAGKLGMPGGEGMPARAWSAGDVLWLGRFVVLYGGLLSLVIARSPQFGVRQVLDGLVGAFAAAALVAVLVLPWLRTGAVADHTTVSVDALLPLLDVLVAGFLVGAGALNGWAVAIWLPLALDMVVFIASEVTDLHHSLMHPSLAIGWATYAGYLASAWLVGLAVFGLVRSPDRPPQRRRPIAPSLLLAGCAVATLVAVSSTRHAALAVGLATASLVAGLLRQALTLRDNDRLIKATEVEAATDALTGLANRRSFENDLRAAVSAATEERPSSLTLFDLDGFKDYNDTFGHPAGDNLLQRLSMKLAQAVAPAGRAYRMGGDEFCVLVPGGHDECLIERARGALADHGEGFTIGASRGTATLPFDSQSPVDALRLADQRMYADKALRRWRRPSPGAMAALLQIVTERDPALGNHTHEVARWAGDVAAALGASPEIVDQARLGGELHDIGKMSTPEAILNKPGPLDDQEWEFMRGIQSSVNGSCWPTRGSRMWRRWRAATTSAGTGRATRTGSRARRFRWRRASCRCATPTRR